jgi:hypothetical protein
MIWSLVAGKVLKSPVFWKCLGVIAVVLIVIVGWRHYNDAIKDAVLWESTANSFEIVATEKIRLYDEMRVEFNVLTEKHKKSSQEYNRALQQIEEMNNEEWRNANHPIDVNDILHYDSGPFE